MPQLGSGLAQGGADTLRLRQEYNSYRIDAVLEAGPVLSFQEWMSQIKGIAPPPNAPT